MDLLSIEHLCTGHRTGGKAWHTVATDLEATLAAGELTCLIGPNGVGKSTLLQTLAGLLPPVSGEVRLMGRSLKDYSPRAIARRVGVVLTDRLDVMHLSVREVVAMGRTPYTGFWGALDEDDWRVVDEAIRHVGIAQLSARMVGTLSDGERQKAMIAKALAQQTPVILLDEPTAFLDYPSKVETMQLLRRLAHQPSDDAAGVAVLLSTHDLEMALQMADRLWLLTAEGRLVTGTPQTLASEGHLAQFIEREGISFDAASLRVEFRK